MTAIQTVSRRTQGPPLCKPLAEVPSSRAAFLEAFPCLNPFSATSLSSIQQPLQELLLMPLDELRQVVPLDVPARSLDLFLCQAARGEPVLGVQAAGWRCNHSTHCGNMHLGCSHAEPCSLQPTAHAVSV